MQHRPAFRPCRRTVVVVMLFAWLLLQALTTVHRVVHAPRLDLAPTGMVASGSFGHEQGDSDCRALDQIGHAEAVPASMANPATFARVDRWLREAAGPLLARQAAGYLARGPPIAG